MDWNARLAGFTRRVRWMRFYKFALIGASIGAFISVLLAVLDWAKVLYSEPLVLGIPLIGGALIGSIIGWVLKVDSKQLSILSAS